MRPDLSTPASAGHSRLFSSTAPAPPRPYTLSLHDALPISSSGTPRASRRRPRSRRGRAPRSSPRAGPSRTLTTRDRKSTRLNSSHVAISYAVFCLKKKILAPTNPIQPPYPLRRLLLIHFFC